MISFSILFLPTNNAFAATTYKMTTTADVNIRTTDNTKGKVIGFYKNRTTVTFTAKKKTIGIKQLIMVRLGTYQGNVLLHTKHLLPRHKALLP